MELLRLKEPYKTFRRKHRAKQETRKALRDAGIQKKVCLCILLTDVKEALIFQPLPFVWNRFYAYLSFRHRGTAKFVYGLAVVIDYTYFIVYC